MKSIWLNSWAGILILSWYYNVVSQPLNTSIDVLNHRKYWYFKSRLNNDFIKVGLNPGESLPFMQRGLGSNNFSSPTSVLKIGDGTSILGYYIAQLALEYYLLQQNNQSTDSTLYELTCALYALNRVDIAAEQKLGFSGGLLNGFFIRDDMPCDFVQNNYEHFNYYSKGINNNTQSRGFASYFLGGMKDTESDWCNYSYPGSLETQDQLYNLLFGLAFVRKLIPSYVQAIDRDGNPFWFQDGQQYIREEAKAIAKRLIDNVRDPKKYDGSSCEGSGGTGWHIRNSLNCNKLGTWLSGYDLTGYSYALAESECMLNSILTPGVQWEDNQTFYVSPSYCSGFFDFPGAFHNVFSRTAGYALWTNSVPWWNMDMKVFDGNLTSICNCKYKTVVFGGPRNNTPAFLFDLMDIKIKDNINLVSAPLEHPLISWSILHGGSLYVGVPYIPISSSDWLNYMARFSNLANTCPCHNIYYLKNESPQFANFNWSTDNRMDHPNRLGGLGQNFQGEYNGIDFMVFHNLWYTYNQRNLLKNTYFTDLSHIYINKNNNWYQGNVNSNPNLGNQVKNIPINIDAFEYVTIERTEFPIFKDSYIRAGKYIHLTPGTWLRPATKGDTCTECIASDQSQTFGTVMRLYVQNYSSACETGSVCDGCRIMKNENDSVPPESKYPAFFHSVEYPEIISNFDEEINRNEGGNEIENAFANENNFIIGLYPNPAKEYFYIKTNKSKSFTLQIYDPTGKWVKGIDFTDCSDKCFIDVHDLIQGLYLVKVTIKNTAECFTFKMSIQK